MAHAVETMAYAGQVPWHGLGVPVDNNLTPQQILVAAGLDWTVKKQPMYLGEKFDKDARRAKIPGSYALVRETDGKVLTIVGETYKPVQNEAAFEFFKGFVDAGHMTMETTGSLWGGRYVWALARIGHDFKVGKGDEIKSYLLLASPHVRGKALLIQYTPIRVVCWNTLTFAVGSDLKGRGNAFRMPHCTAFDDAAKGQATQCLGLAVKQNTQFQELAGLLAKKKASADDVEDFFKTVLRFDPKTARKKKDGTPREPNALPMFRHALEHAPGQELPTARGTWWGAVNAVSYVLDHEVGRASDTALKNSWLGHLANVKRNALYEAAKRAA